VSVIHKLSTHIGTNNVSTAGNRQGIGNNTASATTNFSGIIVTVDSLDNQIRKKGSDGKITKLLTSLSQPDLPDHQQ